ncbi:MAG: response regulator transcription factor [Lentimicrobium sp.]|nr:response regulator transcription factor [Lentimicrobium sp.]
METINILIADDHEIIHNGIEDILRLNKNYKIVGHAYNGQEAVDKALNLSPDVIFMDISMPVLNGIEAIKILNEKLTKAKIIALTQHDETEYVTQALLAGAMGYLIKNSKKEDFYNAIETVLKNRRYLSGESSEKMVDKLLDTNSSNHEQKIIHLTRREHDILQKISADRNNQEIADELNISLRTVETHRRNLMQKLKVNSVVGLLKYASKNNLIHFD